MKTNRSSHHRGAAPSRSELKEVRELWNKLQPPGDPVLLRGTSEELRHYLQIASYRVRLRLAILNNKSRKQSDQDFRQDFAREMPQLEAELRLCERIAFVLLAGDPSRC